MVMGASTVRKGFNSVLKCHEVCWTTWQTLNTSCLRNVGVFFYFKVGFNALFKQCSKLGRNMSVRSISRVRKTAWFFFFRICRMSAVLSPEKGKTFLLFLRLFAESISTQYWFHCHFYYLEPPYNTSMAIFPILSYGPITFTYYPLGGVILDFYILDQLSGAKRSNDQECNVWVKMRAFKDEATTILPEPCALERYTRYSAKIEAYSLKRKSYWHHWR